MTIRRLVRELDLSRFPFPCAQSLPSLALLRKKGSMSAKLLRVSYSEYAISFLDTRRLCMGIIDYWASLAISTES
jgi:hypothetical protein